MSDEESFSTNASIYLLNLPPDYLFYEKNSIAQELWLYDQLIYESDGEIRNALEFARKEAIAISLDGGWLRMGSPHVPESGQYAYRAIMRRSDGAKMPTHLLPPYVNDRSREMTTFDYAINSIGILGVDYDGIYPQRMIQPYVIWAGFLLPTITNLEAGVDTSMLMIYRHRLFVADCAEDPEMMYLINIEKYKASQVTRIPKTQKQKDGASYPYLRDNLIGAVVIRWDCKDLTAQNLKHTELRL